MTFPLRPTASRLKPSGRRVAEGFAEAVQPAPAGACRGLETKAAAPREAQDRPLGDSSAPHLPPPQLRSPPQLASPVVLGPGLLAPPPQPPDEQWQEKARANAKINLAARWPRGLQAD